VILEVRERLLGTINPKDKINSKIPVQKMISSLKGMKGGIPLMNEKGSRR